MSTATGSLPPCAAFSCRRGGAPVSASDHWARLDAFEGEEYDRVVAPAKRTDGQEVDAHVYVHKVR